MDGGAIRVHFELDQPCVVGWQIYDPETGAFLFEGEWQESRAQKCDVRVVLPEDDGAYRVQVAPVEDRERFVLIDAHVSAGAVAMAPARVASVAAMRAARVVRSIPKALTLPPKSLWRNRKLIGSMVHRDILAKYKGSFFGAMWMILNPLLLMATYAFVFGVVLKTRFGNESYVLYFLAGMLPWLAFSEAVGRSTYVILEYRNYVKKLVFPLETLPVNLVIAGAVTEAFGVAIFLIGLIMGKQALPLSVVWLPLLIIPQLLFTAGLCWFLAALGVFVRDLATVTTFALTLWFFMTPICYPETQLPASALRILRFNPLFVLVRGYRAVFLQGHAPGFAGLAGLWVLGLLAAVAGYAWFHKMRRSFADIV